jgi:hypothetical protein
MYFDPKSKLISSWKTLTKSRIWGFHSGGSAEEPKLNNMKDIKHVYEVSRKSIFPPAM